MSEQKRYTLAEAHKEFAQSLNGRVWQLLGQPERTPAEDEEMVLAAHASLYHWLHAGTAVHAQRGQWLLAHVYTVLEEPALAMKHASRCKELTKAHAAEMADFDLAYAHEALARAYALQGDIAKAKKYFDMAAKAGEAIADAESKEIFQSDFRSGNWYGVA
ncbi:MAG: hypothetical protein FJ015_07655 [Chloroflexi bacterium]|nr:hypothetical protein [Chloroflexota bacterium]